MQICAKMSKRGHYNAIEAARQIGVNYATLYRWIQKGWIADVSRDYKGDRVFTVGDIQRITKWKETLRPAPGRPKKGESR